LTAVGLGLVVLAASAALDYVCVRYQQEVATGRSVRAGACSVLLYLLGLVGSLAVLQTSRWYILPECFGLFVGTAVAVRHGRVPRDEGVVE